MPTRLFRHSLAMFARERGGAERAEGARHPVGKTQVRILYGSCTQLDRASQGGGRSRRFRHPFSVERQGMSKAKAARIRGCTEEDAPF